MLPITALARYIVIYSLISSSYKLHIVRKSLKCYNKYSLRNKAIRIFPLKLTLIINQTLDEHTNSIRSDLNLETFSKSLKVSN